MDANAAYDPRYLHGIVLFNAGEYFDAHEVWEDWWHDTAGPERRFIQALIQVSVAVYHANNGNVRGATRLYHSANAYMKPFGPCYLALDCRAWWQGLERAFQPILAEGTTETGWDNALVPPIVLNGVAWPMSKGLLAADE